MEDIENLLNFPEVPTISRPRPLYVAVSIPADCYQVLKEKGWQIIDIRTMPMKTDTERADAVKACLEGVRVGSLFFSKEQRDLLELEAKICGLLSNKEPLGDRSNQIFENADLEEILNFGIDGTAKKSEAPKPVAEIKEPEKRASGRPRGPAKSNSLEKRLRGFALKAKLDGLRKQGKHLEAAKLEASDGLIDSIKEPV
jgi:hypothetical protein